MSPSMLPSLRCLDSYGRKFKEFEPSAVHAYLTMIGVITQLGTATDAQFERHGFTRGRFQILMMLLQKQDDHTLTPAELADACGVTRATVTGLLDSLENAGHILREPKPDDRRGLAVRLTEAGRTTLERMLPDHYRRIGALMRGLSDDERTTFVSLLNKIHDKLPEMRDP